jgi:hypothetical protein
VGDGEGEGGYGYVFVAGLLVELIWWKWVIMGFIYIAMPTRARIIYATALEVA